MVLLSPTTIDSMFRAAACEDAREGTSRGRGPRVIHATTADDLPSYLCGEEVAGWRAADRAIVNGDVPVLPEGARGAFARGFVARLHR